MRTLVDCACETKVHKDGSGVEVYMCPLHEVAPELLEALSRSNFELRMVRDFYAWLGNRQGETDTLNALIAANEAAIAKAGGAA